MNKIKHTIAATARPSKPVYDFAVGAWVETEVDLPQWAYMLVDAMHHTLHGNRLEVASGPWIVVNDDVWNELRRLPLPEFAGVRPAPFDTIMGLEIRRDSNSLAPMAVEWEEYAR